jgi:hypothetical protein
MGTPNSQSRIPRPMNHHLIETLTAERLRLPGAPVCTLAYLPGIGLRLSKRLRDRAKPSAAHTLAKVQRCSSTPPDDEPSDLRCPLPTKRIRPPPNAASCLAGVVGVTPSRQRNLSMRRFRNRSAVICEEGCDSPCAPDHALSVPWRARFRECY